jgi:hypothetical protein
MAERPAHGRAHRTPATDPALLHAGEESVITSLSAAPGRATVRRALHDVEADSWSVAEADLRHLVSRSSVLTPLWLNPLLPAPDGVRLPTPDGWFDTVGLAVQVHSWRWHSSRSDWDATVMQDGVYAEYGVPVVGVTPHAIRQAPDQVLRRLERAHTEAARRPRPAVRATPRDALGRVRPAG